MGEGTLRKRQLQLEIFNFLGRKTLASQSILYILNRVFEVDEVSAQGMSHWHLGNCDTAQISTLTDWMQICEFYFRPSNLAPGCLTGAFRAPRDRPQGLLSRPSDLSLQTRTKGDDRRECTALRCAKPGSNPAISKRATAPTERYRSR